MSAVIDTGRPCQRCGGTTRRPTAHHECPTCDKQRHQALWDRCGPPPFNVGSDYWSRRESLWWRQGVRRNGAAFLRRDYIMLLLQQANRCAGCGRSLECVAVTDGIPHSPNTQVDHDRSSGGIGEVRGIVCRSCNVRRGA